MAGQLDGGATARRRARSADASAPPASLSGVSLVICSYNRRPLVQKLVDSILVQLPVDYPLQLVLVDNNSTDDTADYGRALVKAHPFVTYVQETRQGLSHARNAGAAAAVQEYILYLDDDALLPPHYLGSLGALLAEHQPDFFGGPVYPDYVDPKPVWFPESLEIRRKTSVSGFDHNATLSGGNLGVRRSVLDKVGGFDPRYGMSGKRVGMLDERLVVEAYRRIVPAEKQRLYYSLDHYILHRTAKNRMTVKFQVKRIYIANHQLIRYNLEQGVRTPGLLVGQAWRMFWQNFALVVKALPYIWKHRRDDPERPMNTLIKLTHRLADLHGALQFQLTDFGRAARRRRAMPVEDRPLRVIYFRAADSGDDKKTGRTSVDELREALGEAAQIQVTPITDTLNDDLHKLGKQLNLRAADLVIVNTPKAARALAVLRPALPHLQIVLWLSDPKQLSYLFAPRLMWTKRRQMLSRILQDRDSFRSADAVVCGLPRQARRWVRWIIPMRDCLYVPRMPPAPGESVSKAKRQAHEALRVAAREGWAKVLAEARIWAPRRLAL